MQPIETYSTTEEFLRCIIQAPPGSGKTTLACQFPNAYIVDCDLNIGGALRWLKKNNRQLPVGYDTIDRDEKGDTVPENLRYQRMAKCLAAAAADEKVGSIVIDSATKVSDYIIAEILRQQNKPKMDIQMWGFYFTMWKHLISQVTSVRKNFVLICHEKVEKDEVDQSLKYFLMIPGQFGQIAGSLFTDVWHCEVQSSGGIAPTYKWLVRTMPDFRYQLKNSLGLPPTFEFSWPLIQQHLNGSNTPSKA